MSRTPTQPVRQRAPREKDRAYLDSFRGAACETCGAEDDTVVGAHVRSGGHSGLGAKPDDSLVVGLCHSCHTSQEDNPGEWWWFHHVFKNMLRKRHAEWKAGK